MEHRLTLVKGLYVAPLPPTVIIHCPRPNCLHVSTGSWGKAERDLAKHLLTVHRAEFLQPQAGECA